MTSYGIGAGRSGRLGSRMVRYPEAVNAQAQDLRVRPVSQRAGAPRAVLLGAVAVVVALPLVVTLVLGEDAYQRRDYPGAVVGPLTSVLRSGVEVASLVTVGALVATMFLSTVRATRTMQVTSAFDAMTVRRGAFWWMLLALAMAVFDAVDSFGVSPQVLSQPSNLVELMGVSSFSRAWLVAAVVGLLIFASTFLAHLWWHFLLPLWLGAVGVLAPVVVGSVLVGPNHDIGSDAAIVLTVLNAAVVGSAVVLSLALAAGRDVAPLAVRRWAHLTRVAAPAMVVFELVVVWFKLAGTSPVGSLTGWLSIARLVCLGLVWWAAVRIARDDNSTGADGEGAADSTRFLLVAAASGLVAAGAQVALTRFLSPQFYVDVSTSEIYLGFDVTDPPTLSVLLLGWRPNLLFLTSAGTALVLYLLGVRRLRRNGDAWSRGRVISFVAGCLVLVAATSSGFGKYSGADFAIHMGVHMALNMLAPLLLVMGGPVTLALRALRPGSPPGPREWIVGAIDSPVARLVYHPLLVFLLFIGSYYALYLTGLFEFMSRDHWAHQIMNIHFVLVGMLYYGLTVGVDRTPFQLPHVARLGYVIAAMPFHAFFAISLLSSERVIAQSYYEYLELPWATDLLATQYDGGIIAWAGGEIPLVIVILALLAQWKMQDDREAKRKDRHLDTGLDDEFDAYNEMMRRLNERPGLDQKR